MSVRLSTAPGAGRTGSTFGETLRNALVAASVCETGSGPQLMVGGEGPQGRMNQ